MNILLIDSVVRSVFFVSQNSIDKFGYTMDDYRSIMSIKYLEIKESNILLDDCSLKPYLYKVAKNFKIDLSRKYKQNYFLFDYNLCSYSDEYIEAVEAIDILQNKLTLNEYYLLLKWVFKTYNDSEINSGFYREVHNILQKAKEFLR